MTVSKTTTPFALGAYIGNANNASAADQATFNSKYDSFTSLMGAAPSYLDVYIDQNQSIDRWDGNSQWESSSFAASADARTTIPVIALPLNSNASGSPTPDQSYQAFASGKYDGVIQAIVKDWASQGFNNLVFKPGWEMNLQGPTYAGDDAKSQADWVSAFQHVYTTLHQAAAADGINVQVMWNPGVTNYSNAEATTNLYPGNNYVDLIGADVYSDIYPYSDGGSTPAYHDWDTGLADTSVAQFIADPVNREHFWSNPAATKYSLDGSGGHSQSLTSLITFAEQHGKAFAIPETGAGNSDGGQSVADDAAFPQWLSQQLVAAQAAGETISFVNLWDSNGGGNYQFSSPSDNKPLEAAAWARYFGAQTATAATPPAAPAAAAPAVVTPPAVAPAVVTPVTIGSGPDTLALTMSEDAWQGDAQFTVTVDGKQIGGVQTTTATNAAGQSQIFNVLGTFGAGSHQVGVNFLNDAYGGSASMDRNLDVKSATIDGVAIQNSALSLLSQGIQSFAFNGPAAAQAAPASPAPVTIATGPDTLALTMSEDAWQGDAQFTVTVDGKQIGGVQTTTATNAAGQSQLFNVLGTFGAGSHQVGVNFLNDAFGGSASMDRNLDVKSATIDGVSIQNSALSLMSQGTQSFAFTVPTANPPIAVGQGPDTLTLQMNEDAWQGDAQFTVAINGTTIGGVLTTTASHAAGATQAVSVSGSFGASPTIGINFINDAYGGSATADRNLYVNSATYDGVAVKGAPAALYSNGTANVTVPSTALTLNLAEDAWQGDAQYAVTVDGKTLVQNGTATALQSQGKSQAVTMQALLTAGTHDLAVSFLNDAYGGSGAMDRNLYVTGVAVNGAATPGATAALYSSGTQHFQIVVPTSA